MACVMFVLMDIERFENENVCAENPSHCYLMIQALLSALFCLEVCLRAVNHESFFIVVDH